MKVVLTTSFILDSKHLVSWVVAFKWTIPRFVCAPLVTSKFLRGLKSFDKVVIKVDFGSFKEITFNTSNCSYVMKKWYCEMCQVGKI